MNIVVVSVLINLIKINFILYIKFVYFPRFGYVRYFSELASEFIILLVIVLFSS